MRTKIDITQTLRGAFVDLLDNSVALLLGALILTVAVSGFSTLLYYATPQIESMSEGGQLAAIFGVLVLVLGVWSFFYLGLIGMSAKIQKRGKPKLAEVFTQGSRIMPGWIAGVFVNGVLFGLPALLILLFGHSETGALLVAGGMLVWLPLVYAATSLTMFFVVDGRQPALTAIASSVRATRGNLLRILGALFLAGLIGGLFSLLPLVGSLASLCFQVLVVSKIYARLSAGARRSPLV